NSAPDHLRPTIVVEDADGLEIASGKAIAALRAQCGERSAAAIREAMPDLERTSLEDWPDVPLTPHEERGALAMPGLIAEDDGTVSLRVFPTRPARDVQHPRGVARLLALKAPLKVADLRLSDADKLALGRNPHGSVAGLLEDASTAIALDLMDEAGGAPVSADEFTGLLTQFRQRRATLMRALLLEVLPAIEDWWQIRQALDAAAPATLAAAREDVEVHLGDLTGGDFLTRARPSGIADLRRYLTALRRRLASLPADAGRDLVRMDQVHQVEDAYLALSAAKRATSEGRAIRADLAELRVSLWAQDLGTPRPVSQKRLLDRITALSR
ncbi:MAG: DUF3418 domain-containing protein, partial [Candidatus Nanopelagicales bacterium]